MKRLLISMLALSLLGCSCIYIQPATSTKEPSVVINSFIASPQSIQPGKSAKLTWDVKGAVKASIDQGIGNIALSGATVVSPGSTTVYTLTATSFGGANVTAIAQVTVSPAGSPVVNSFTINPSTISAGSSATLSWSVVNATSITIDNGIGNVSASGGKTVSPASTTGYTLTASNGTGTTVATARITVLTSGSTPPPPPSPEADVTQPGPTMPGTTLPGSGITQPGPTMQGTPVPGKVTSVITAVSPTTWNGDRPYTFRCSAMIRVDGSCTVTYIWERSDGGSSPQQTETFTAAGSKEVSTGWPREVDGAYWVRVHVLTPNDVVSNQANFTLAPVEAVANRVTNVTVTCMAYYTGKCPSDYYSNVYMGVTGPCRATFVVDRSDGWTSSVYSQDFTYAGEWFGVGDRLWWTPSTNGNYWWRVRVLTPNEMSDQCNFTVACPARVTSVVAGVIPTSFTGLCPHNFVCYADITVDGQCTVHYVWERSDGGTSPEQTIDFTSARTTRVNTGWPRETNGSYWVRVRTLSPTVVVSNKAGFSLQCQ